MIATIYDTRVLFEVEGNDRHFCEWLVVACEEGRCQTVVASVDANVAVVVEVDADYIQEVIDESETNPDAMLPIHHPECLFDVVVRQGGYHVRVVSPPPSAGPEVGWKRRFRLE